MSHYSTQPKPPPVRLQPMLPLLIAISMIAPLTINIILPALPGMVIAFGTTRETAQLAISAYLFTIAVGQIVIGPISDRFGRRPTLMGCALIYSAGSLIGMYAPTIEVLIGARMLQALGATSGISLARAVISDVSNRADTARIIAYLTATMVLAPMAAPNIGSYLDTRFGWQAIFAFSACLGLFICVFGFLQLTETRPAGLNATTAREVAARSFSLLKDREYLRYAMVTTTATASYLAFIGGTPHYFIDHLKRSPAEYGLWLILLGIGYAAGNLLSARFGHRIGLLRLAALGNVILLLTSTTMAVLSLAGLHHPAALFIPAMLMTFGNGLVMPNTSAFAVQVNPLAAGAASGLMGCIQMGAGAISTYLLGWIPAESALPVSLVIMFWGVLAVLLMPTSLIHRSGPATPPRS
jgi:DHA1 family bicyclomycin/chloramphenicol resistance-like MFS transporter